jgi:hypothetical protein
VDLRATSQLARARACVPPTNVDRETWAIALLQYSGSEP